MQVSECRVGKEMMKAKKTLQEMIAAAEGFTIIEVMIALVILGIGVLAVVGLQTRSMSYNASSKRETEGYTWAMDQAERLLALPYTDTELSVQGTPTVVGDGHMVTRAPYSVEWDVTDNSANIPNSKIVNIFVRWNGREISRVDLTRVQDSF
ncbi:MAG TPA: type IV pilus modification protein PilV [Desulfobulbus sp.]|nr:type IV pilus modification protein PilV [Desulfobulbus sp.]